MPRILACIIVLFISVHLKAQIIPFTVEPVKITDFTPHSSLVKPDIDAVYLQEKGETILDASPHFGFYTTFHYFKRLLIISKNGLELATDHLYYNTENDGKKLKTLHVATYNLENGQIVKTDLPEKDRYVEDPKQSVHSIKYAYPNAKVGSILEMEFTTTDGNTNLKNWYFQKDYPILHSSYSVSLPKNWNFVITLQNKKYLTEIKKDSIVKNLYSWNYEYEGVKIYTINWKFDNIPAMKTEPFTSTIKNYLGCIKFQLAVRPVDQEKSEKLLNSWQWLSDWLMIDYEFGLPIENPNPWIYKLSNSIVQPEDNDLTKGKKIFAYFRDHMKCVSEWWLITDNKTLEAVYKSGQGNTAEINLLLIALLRTQKLHAESIILATRGNGAINEEYPVLGNFNYTICRLAVSGKYYYLDASDPTMGFGRLPTQCYNGQARVINKIPSAVSLSPDSIRESSNIIVSIENDPSGKFLSVDWTEHPGYYSSSDIRKNIRENNNNQETYCKSYVKEKAFSESIDSFAVENIKDLDGPVTITFKTTIRPGDADHIYFNPMMSAGLGKIRSKARPGTTR